MVSRHNLLKYRQEDAQEFLSFTMDQLHNELLCLEGASQNSANHTTMASEDDDWETVGPKNRTAVVRTHTFNKSALSDIFGGELCSVVKTKGLPLLFYCLFCNFKCLHYNLKLNVNKCF